eukprot:Gregarina_sp_Poly_1__10235@NODE_710_length_6658_cov_139_932484_g537_i0_p11_GENE_NODE_710_length_6658_cov_139_932484_g537_i0NODE_710_length_6658_cov_139_932484_g537_i0_p11_ORF_typecomplete_len103_score17_20_NODE_710_length_6658_cov_139_932484_g537_i055985906
MMSLAYSFASPSLLQCLHLRSCVLPKTGTRVFGSRRRRTLFNLIQHVIFFRAGGGDRAGDRKQETETPAGCRRETNFKNSSEETLLSQTSYILVSQYAAEKG